MRFMMIVKGELPPTEDGGLQMPSEEGLAAMGKFNEEMVKAGVMLAGEGLQPSAKGARVVHNGDNVTVIDGPFAETKELIAGYWLIQAKSLDEAIEWAKRCPNLAPDGVDNAIEIRQIFEDDDFGDEFTPELREQERRIREQAEANAIS